MTNNICRAGLLLQFLIAGLCPAAVIERDICVYGGTAAGVTAAVQAARLSKSVVLLEPGKHIGGMTSGGLGATDIGNKGVIGSLSREFYRRVAQHYADDSAWKWETRAEYFANNPKRTKLEEVSGADATMWTFEPHVAERILQQMLDEAKVPVRLQQPVASVKKDGARITEITLTNGDVCRAKMFIDATYEGDLMAKAGVSYRVGREANALYGETLNGIRAHTPKNQIFGSIDPYVIPGKPASGLIPLIQPGKGGTPGQGDHRVQAYNFRLCFTTNAANRLPLTPPKGYDPARYELVARRAEKIVATGNQPRFKDFCNPVWMPNGKTDINNGEGISTDFIGGNYDYPDADYAARAKIWQAHEDYIRGFWYFMSTSPRVPESLRTEFKSFGPAKDEFPDTGGWPYQLYVREARRMHSDYVMTEHNCRSKVVAEDPVGMAAYGMDSHNCQRIVQNGAARNEGDVQQHGLRPYPISYRAIVPKAAECENLLVPVCVSATHIAFGSIRMEPVFMVLGQSSAIAAAMAIEENTSVQQLNYPRLRSRLIAARQVLDPPPKPAAKPTDRMAWWRDAKFGMFIHWGGYSKAGGEWKGETNHAEWLQFTAKIPLAEYTEYARTFNPDQFNAGEWVKTAKDAGMKYLVVTAKHHDGIAMYDSASSAHNIVKLAGLKFDPLKQLSEACRKQGVRFCVYYSLGRDWQDPDVPTGTGKTKPGWRSNLIDYPDEDKKDFAKYFDRKVKPQVRELLTSYGPVGVMWFDTPERISPAQSEELLQLIHSLQPDCIVNQRIGNKLGDYGTPEQTIPNEVSTQPWETCMTVNGHWGYNQADHNWKSSTNLLRNLIDIVSKGGNYLLNVGPTGEGVIPEPSVERLEAIGKWLRVNGAAIYGCGPTPFGGELGALSATEQDKNGKPKFIPTTDWRATTRPGKIYLHLFQWPSGKLEIPAVPGEVTRAYLLADPDRQEIQFTQTSTEVSIFLPGQAPDAVASVLCLELAN